MPFTRRPANSLRQCLLRTCQSMLVVASLLAAPAQAQTFTTLYSFTGGSDGAYPVAQVIQDSDGNLYGTASEGGDLNCQNSGCGVVFKVDTAGTETVLHTFSGPDGAYPDAKVTRDIAGNIYGTTLRGGSGSYGTVFRINTAGKETVLHSFAGGVLDGCYPDQGLRRIDGNWYGTTWACGASNLGTIFKVDSRGNFTLLHSFAGYPSDGQYPSGGRLAIDGSGNLYGVTNYGGVFGCGALYELSGSGKLKVLHSFAGNSTDGCYPWGSVVRDGSGNLYGTTNSRGASNYGNIWMVSKNGKETILHNFTGSTSDGCYPFAGVSLDAKGNLYGVTLNCGAYGAGVLYELSRTGSIRLLHSFDGPDGAVPLDEVHMTDKGTLFGTTEKGGGGTCLGQGCGTVWSYVPKSLCE